MRRLARLLGIPIHTAIGLMQLFWEYAAEYARDGDVARLEAQDIADGIEWAGDADELLTALFEAGWIDRPDGAGRVLIHDWPEHCEDSVHYALARRGLYFADGTKPRLGKMNAAERQQVADAYARRAAAPAQEETVNRADSAQDTRGDRAETARTSADSGQDLPSCPGPGPIPGPGPQGGELEGGRGQDAAPGPARAGPVLVDEEEEPPEFELEPPSDEPLGAPPLPLAEVSGAFAAYGHRIRTWNATRRRTLRSRLREHDGDPRVLATAVHGYVWLHRHPTNGFDPMEHLTPETIFRASNFAKYLEAGLDAAEAGEQPPFQIAPVRRETADDRVKRLMGRSG